MKNSKTVITIILVFAIASFCSDVFAQDDAYTYAYISVNGKAFSKKLKVEVDFGDTPEQIAEGAAYSLTLTNKTSYAAILNHMVDNKYELVETLDFITMTQGTGGTNGVVFIMKKEK